MDYLLPLIAQATSVAEAAQDALPPLTLDNFPAFTWETLKAGGWLMVPLFFLAVAIYFEAMSLYLRLARSKTHKIPRSRWEHWLDHPAEGQGHLGEVTRFVAGDGTFGEDSLMRIEAVKTKIIPEINSRITVLSVLVTLAPLMGLLGTIVGMLDTFRVLSSSAGTAVELVAEGISVALVTTQTGLMIAIPGYILIAVVLRGRNRYLAFISELESVVVQRMHQINGGSNGATS